MSSSASARFGVTLSTGFVYLRVSADNGRQKLISSVVEWCLPNQGAAEYVVSFTLAENTSGNVGAVASDSRCFVASLVFSDSPYILKHLRGFRDNVLLNLPFGDTVVAAYYAHSPFWVNTIRNNQSAIFAIQITLIFFFYLSPLLLLMGLYRKVRYPNTLKKQDSATLGMR